MANILLLEPGYRNKYPPLGLMKIASYHRTKSDNIFFSKGIQTELLKTRWDRVYVTTLFSFEFKRIAEEIDFAIKCAGDQHHRVFVGGIAASLMTDEFEKETRWNGVRFIKGLLDNSPAISLKLDENIGDLYADDTEGKPIENYVPDYSILSDIKDKYIYPVNDAYFGYASRGCIRSCHFCGVPKLEGEQRDGISIELLITSIRKEFGEKLDLILMDNNITASPKYKEIISEIRKMGFEKNATLNRDGQNLKRRVDFNQGVDARILSKDKMFLREMSTICISPLRIAFDHLGLRRSYIKAVQYASEFEITKLSNYMLYNFYDTPDDLYERLRINISLNETLGVRIWSFPMKYLPFNMKDRSHIGEKWIWYWLRSFQIILQATHGVVSGNPQYFNRAFGNTVKDFNNLLLLPHHMIFHRNYYDFYGGKLEKETFMKLLLDLTPIQYNDFIESLSKLTSSKLIGLDTFLSSTKDYKLKSLFEFYYPITKEARENIYREEEQRKVTTKIEIDSSELSEKEWVEDAGLYEDDLVEKINKNSDRESTLKITKRVG